MQKPGWVKSSKQKSLVEWISLPLTSIFLAFLVSKPIYKVLR